MSILTRLRHLVSDPPPEHVFELSPEGLAYARAGEIGFRSFPPGTLTVSPLEDNVKSPPALAGAIEAVAPADGNRKVRRAALILPDYCARIAVLDFDALPDQEEERQSLIRFRVKKNLPFDVDAAVLSYTVQPREHARRFDVLVAALALEVAARYEKPFREAGFHPGLVTVSTLAALALSDAAAPVSPVIVVKPSARVLSIAVLHHGAVRFFRCLELTSDEPRELLEALYPTFALIEDELGLPAQALRLCGVSARWATALEGVFPLRVTRAQSRHGTPTENNAGLLGYLESAGA